MKALQKVQPYLPFLFALLGGGLMPYAFAPYYYGFCSVLSITLFLAAIINTRFAKALFIGWLYGLTMFGIGTSWVYFSIHDFGNAPPLLAAWITALFVMSLALFPATLSALLALGFKKNNATRYLLVFPALWVVFEILRGWLLTGFPWLYVGYTQSTTHLRAFAEIGSIFAVSWATVFVASVLFMLLHHYYQSGEGRRQKPYGLWVAMLAIWGVAFGVNQISWVTPTDKKLHVALVQGNIAQLMRWDERAISSIVQTYRTLTQSALHSSLIIWPEGAIPVALPESLPLFQAMETLLNTHNTGLIAGVPTQSPERGYYYNSLVGVGNVKGLYHKQYLVPFGEYVPFEKTLRGMIDFFNLPMSSMISGPTQQNLFLTPHYKIAPAICYEIAYPFYVQRIAKNADFILTVSNDAWFGSSIGPWQHLEIAQWRARETGKYVIRATNTGITAVIDPEGMINAIAPQFEPYVLHAYVAQMLGQTPWSRYGPWPLFSALAGVLLLACVLRLFEKR